VREPEASFAERIDHLAERAREERAAFEPPDDPEERARRYLREGVGPAVAIYCESHTGGDPAVTGGDLDRLQETFDAWLDLYARCYGVDLAGSYPIRTAAELLVDTHDVVDVAAVLTGVPER
jgi:hypothetical protein